MTSPSLVDAELATRSTPSRRGLRPSDRAVRKGEEPALAAHLVTPRVGFAHHGIYVGSGSVVHYGAFAHGRHRGPVEEVPLGRFIHGHTLWVRLGPTAFDCEEVIRRARSRIGEDCYRLLSNNCEHFCEWCLRDEHRSEQVESALVLPRRFARCIGAAAAGLFGSHYIATERRPFPDQSPAAAS